MNRDDLVERVAEAIIPHFFDSVGLAPEIVTKRKDFARERARAALAIIEPAVREECARVAEHFGAVKHGSLATDPIAVQQQASREIAAGIRANPHDARNAKP